MAKGNLPANFITLKEIDNLSIAGIGVWIVCIVVESIVPSINSFYIRMIALGISCLWSVCQFAKNKQWKHGASYLIMLINAALIFVNAAGFNSITRQSPFEGKKVNADLPEIKSKTQIKASLFNITEQKDWYPDYPMVRYIDTLKMQLVEKSEQNNNLKNLFSYFKDDVKSVTKDASVLQIINKFTLKEENDSSYLTKINERHQRAIDSLQRVITTQKAQLISYSSTSYSISFEGENLPLDKFVQRVFNKMDSLQRVNNRVSSVLNFIKQKKVIPANIDSL